MTADIRIKPCDFSATEITFEAVTEEGKALFASMFGAGAVSATMPKSRAIDFERFVAQKGLAVL